MSKCDARSQAFLGGFSRAHTFSATMALPGSPRSVAIRRIFRLVDVQGEGRGNAWTCLIGYVRAREGSLLQKPKGRIRKTMRHVGATLDRSERQKNRFKEYAFKKRSEATG